MNAAPYWIQSSDFSHRDYPAADAPEIERALNKHDWAHESQRQATLRENSDDECSAGLGIVLKDGRQLIIRPNGDRQCYVEYSFYEKEKVLGLFSKRSFHAGELERVPLAVATGFIAPFLANDYAAVKYDVELHR